MKNQPTFEKFRKYIEKFDFFYKHAQDKKIFKWYRWKQNENACTKKSNHSMYFLNFSYVG